MVDKGLGTSDETHKEFNGNPGAAWQIYTVYIKDKTQPVGEKVKDPDIKRTR